MKTISDVNIDTKGALSIRYEDGTFSKPIIPVIPIISIENPSVFSILSLANIINSQVDLDNSNRKSS